MTSTQPRTLQKELNDKITNFKKQWKQEAEYNNKNYNTSENVKCNMKNWHMIRKIRSIRAIYLSLKKYKDKIYTYDEMKLWMIASKRRTALLNELQAALSTSNEPDKKYIQLCMKTLNDIDLDYDKLPRRSERLMLKHQGESMLM